MAALAPVTPGEMFAAWNWDSPADMKRLFQALGFEVEDTDDETLAGVDHPLAGLLRQYREATQAHRHLRRGLAEARRRPTAGSTPAGTRPAARPGRMSCGEPNMQQLPRDERTAAASSPRPAACWSRPTTARSSCASPPRCPATRRCWTPTGTATTCTRQTAQRVLGKQDVTKEDRQLAKALNFGLLYGMGAQGLRQHAQGRVRPRPDRGAGPARTATPSSAPTPAWRPGTAGEAQRAVETRTLAGAADSSRPRRPTSPKRTGGVRRRDGPAAAEHAGAGHRGRRAEAGPGPAVGAARKCPGRSPSWPCMTRSWSSPTRSRPTPSPAWLKRAMLDAMAPLIDPVPVEVEVKVGPTWGEG